MLAILLALLSTFAATQDQTRYENWPSGALKAEYQVRPDASGEELRHGPWKSWYEDGALAAEGAYEDGLRSGKWTLRWPNGKRKAAGKYVAGQREGRWMEYASSGTKVSQGAYAAGRRTGKWSYWSEDGTPDKRRSGSFEWHVQPTGIGLVWEGEARGGIKDGLWTLKREDGSTLLLGDYGPRGPRGPWVLLHADGSVDREWLSGEYEDGRRVGPLATLPDFVDPAGAAPDPRRASVLRAEATAEAALEDWIASEAGSRLKTQRALEAMPGNALRAGVAKLQGLDLADSDQLELARRINDELLGRLCGASFPWAQPDAEGASLANARTILRWRTLVELSDLESPVWQRMFDSEWRWTRYGIESTPLGSPPLPPGFLVADAKAPPADLDVRAAGTRYALRFTDRSDLPALGGRGTEKVLDPALDWFVRTQDQQGFWEPRTTHELEATALVILAFLGNGELPTEGRRAKAVQRALEWLVRNVRPTGQIRSQLSVDLRSHSLGLQALAEAGELTRLPAVVESARRGRDCLIGAQLEDGSWPRDWGNAQGETLTTVYACFALELMADSSMGCEREPIERAVAWLAERTGADGAVSGDDSGRVPTATAWAALCALEAGRDPGTDAALGRQIEYIESNPSSITLGDPLLDSEYVCLGAHVLARLGGESWKDWNALMKEQLVQVQQRGGPHEGRWIPADVGRRDYTSVTALRALTFEVYFRYAPR